MVPFFWAAMCCEPKVPGLEVPAQIKEYVNSFFGAVRDAAKTNPNPNPNPNPSLTLTPTLHPTQVDVAKTNPKPNAKPSLTLA